MRVIEYEGEVYRSYAEASKALHISNQKLRRLCRHYVRANKNPAVAIDWLLGKEKLKANELKTWKYQQDLERRQDRVQNVFSESIDDIRLNDRH